MGTINYGKSDYITLGINPIDAWDVEHDESLMEELRHEVKEYGGTIDSEIQSYIEQTAEADYENAEAIFEKYDFCYYHIELKSGYYEGFYLDIENNYGLYYDDYEEKREALKEIREIEKMLIELAGCGMVSVWPGWVTKYRTYEETLKDIKEAAKEMRQEVRSTPTWRQYEKEGMAA